MKYYSDELKKLFDSQEECEEAEKEAIAARKRAEEEKEKLVLERKARASEVEEARKVMIEAQKNYETLLRNFIRDYKTYHYSTSNIEDLPRLLDDFLFRW